MYQSSSSHSNPLNSIVSRKRNRGVMLSKQGWQKLAQANVLHDEQGNRFTYEKLSERSLLNERTISRILNCEFKVDKRTLKIFFTAFGLRLGSSDYTTAEFYPVGKPLTSPSSYLNPFASTVETNSSYQELIELHQRLMQDLKHVSQLLNLDEVGENTQRKQPSLNNHNC